MKLYKDIHSGEEIVTDSFNFEYEFDNVLVKIQSKWVMEGGEQIDIGGGNAFGGAGEDEGCDDKAEKKLDVLAANKYQSTSFDKKAFTSYVKGFMKKTKAYLEEHNPQRVEGFMKAAPAAVKWILNNFDEFEFYLPESYDTENSIILSYYEEGAECPKFVYFIDGLKGQNV